MLDQNCSIISIFNSQNIRKKEQTCTKTKLNKAQFFQINLQKSKTATSNLANCMVNWSNSPFFVSVQEPATYRGRIGSLPSGTQIFAADNPRAAIMCSPDLNTWALAEHTTRDVAACLWKTTQEACPEIVVILLYADIYLNPTIPKELPGADKLSIPSLNLNFCCSSSNFKTEGHHVN